MLRGIRSRLTYANVMSTVAVFIALGGVSYAAVKLPRNSVGSAQIKKNAVTGAKVRSGAINTSDLSKAVRAQLAKAGVPGPQGLAGPQGTPGPAGTPDGYTKTQADATFVASSRFQTATVNPTATTRQTIFDLPDLGIVFETDGTADASLVLCYSARKGAGFELRGAFGGTATPPLSLGATFYSDIVVAGGCAGNATASHVDVWVWKAVPLVPSTDPLTPVLHLECGVSAFGSDKKMVCTATRL